MRPTLYKILSCISLLALTHCGVDFDPGSRITSLRVLAIKADQPFAKPGEPVSFETLYFDPVPDRNLTWGWAVCVNPDSTSVLGCIAKIVADAQKTGKPPAFQIAPNRTSFSFQIPQDALISLPANAQSNASVGLLTIACPGTLQILAKTSNPNALPFQCIDTSGRVLALNEFEAGIKRVFIRARDRNANPSIAKITWDGADWPETEIKQVTACDTDGNRYDRCDGAERHQVALWADPASFENGINEFGSDFNEQVVVQYYATEGLFENEVVRANSPQTGWVARKAARGQTLNLWMVIRDNRGGVNWAMRKVSVL